MYKYFDKKLGKGLVTPFMRGPQGDPGIDGQNGVDGNDGQDGQDGASSFKQSVFIRSNEKPETPTGGSYDNPMPVQSDYSSEIPDGDTILWQSNRIFSTDLTKQQTEWSTPVKMTDTADFDVEYSSLENPEDPVGHPNTNSEGSNNSDNAIWMATSKCKNGVGSDWAVNRIKGEKGERGADGRDGQDGVNGTDGKDGQDGEDGTSVYIEGKFKTLDSLKDAWNSYINGDHSKFTGTLDPGDGYFVDEDGYLYVYSGGWTDGDDTAFDLYGTGVLLKGEPGASANIIVKFSNDGGKSFTDDNGETPGRYIGVCYYTSDSIPNLGSVDSYTGSLGRGEDGGGYEQGFTLSKFNPGLPVTSNDDGKEIGHDDPQEPTKDEGDCGVIYRTMSGTENDRIGGEFKGPVKYSSYTENPHNLILTNSFDQLYVDSEGRTVSAQTITSGIQYYVGNEPQTDFIVEIDDSNLPEGVSAYSEDSSIEIQVASGVTISSDFAVGITVGSIKKEFVVKVIQGNIDYDLWVSKNVFKTGDEIEFCVYKTDLLTNERQKFNIGNINHTFDVDFVRGEDATVVKSDDGLDYKITNNYLEKSITLSIVHIDTYEILDQQTITWIKDGADGSDGAPGADGITKFKSTVFTRSVGTPTTPSGGNFSNPNPTDGIWEDGIPDDGSDPIWSSYRWFSNEAGFDSSWSDPVLMCDTPDFEVIYSSLEDITNCNPNDASDFYKDADGGIDGWLEKTGLINKWSDDGDTDSIWMATINKTNGIWGNWTISKIKGENATTYSLVLSSNTFKVPGEQISIHVTKIYGNNPPEVVGMESVQEYLKIVIRDSNEQLYDSSTDGDGGDWSESEGFYYTYNIQTSSTVELGHYNSDAAEWILIDSQTIKEIKDGEPGPQGERGKMVYPAGTHDPNKGYDCSDNCVPYVQDNETKKYYVLIKNVPENSNIAVTNTDYWEPMETFNSVFTDLIVAKYGNIGGAVYYTQTNDGVEYQFLISNRGCNLTFDEGKITSMEQSGNYIDFAKNGSDETLNLNETDLLDTLYYNSKFIPNIMMCFTTGDAGMGAGSIKMYSNSKSVINGIEQTPVSGYSWPSTLSIDFSCNDADYDSRYFNSIVFSSVNVSEDPNNENLLKVSLYQAKYEENNPTFHLAFRKKDSQTGSLSLDMIDVDSLHASITLNKEDGIKEEINGRSTGRKYGILFGSDFLDNLVFTYNKNEYTLIRDGNYGHYIGDNGNADISKSFYIYFSDRVDSTIQGNLVVEGSLYCDSIINSSDECLKSFKDVISVDLDKLACLRKSYFTFNDSPESLKLGMSAQEVQTLYPEIVNTDPNGYLGIDYSKLSVIALKAVDILHDKNKELEQRIFNLEQRLNS